MKPVEEVITEEAVIIPETVNRPTSSESVEMGERKILTPPEVASEEQPKSSPRHTQEGVGKEAREEPEKEAIEEPPEEEAREEVQKETEEKPKQVEVVEKRELSSPEVTPEEGDSTYEDMTVNEVASDDAETYEPMDYDRVSKPASNQGAPPKPPPPEEEDRLEGGQTEKERKLDAGSPNYVPMKPAKLGTAGKQPSEPEQQDYEEVETVVNGDKDSHGSHEYEHPEGWGDSSRHLSMGFEPKAVDAETTYDILPPPRPLYTNGDSTISASTSPQEVGGAVNERPAQSPEVGRRSHSLSSCGSGSSEQFENVSMQARKGSKGGPSLSSSRSNSVTGGSGLDVGVGRAGRLNSLEVRW